MLVTHCNFFIEQLKWFLLIPQAAFLKFLFCFLFVNRRLNFEQNFSLKKLKINTSCRIRNPFEGKTFSIEICDDPSQSKDSSMFWFNQSRNFLTVFLLYFDRSWNDIAIFFLLQRFLPICQKSELCSQHKTLYYLRLNNL